MKMIPFAQIKSNARIPWIDYDQFMLEAYAEFLLDLCDVAIKSETIQYALNLTTPEGGKG